MAAIRFRGRQSFQIASRMASSAVVSMLLQGKEGTTHVVRPAGQLRITLNRICFPPSIFSLSQTSFPAEFTKPNSLIASVGRRDAVANSGAAI